MPQASSLTQYAGFISYSQRDKKYAKKIHAALEAFRLPVELAPSGSPKRKLGKFFRDDDELSGSPSLGEALEAALEASASLIVIASPNAAQSKWVDKEVRRFKSKGKQARVFAVIVDGLPDTEDETQRCFPPSLLWQVNAEGELTDIPDEPLAPDIRKEPFNRLITRLVAGLLGLDFDTLWQRERRRIARQRTLAFGAAVVVAGCLSVTGWLYQNAENERLRNESINLAAQAQSAMNQGQQDTALNQLLQALPTQLANPDRPVVPEALVALRRLMTQQVAAGVLHKFDQPVRQLRVLSSDYLAVWLDDFSVRTVNLSTGEVHQKFDAKGGYDWLYGSSLGVIAGSNEYQDDQGYYRLDHKVEVRNLIDAKLEYSTQFKDDDWYISPYQPTVSPSGKRVLGTRSVSAPPDEQSQLAVWTLQQGGEFAPPVERAVLAGPALQEDDRLTTRFVDDDHMVLAWGQARQNLAVWNIPNNQLTNLAVAEESSACEGTTLEYVDDAKDRVALSSDLQTLSRSRPLQGGGVCVERWKTSSWQPMPTLVFISDSYGVVETFSDGTVVLSGDGYWRNASVWKKGGKPQTIKGCGYPAVQGLLPEQNSVVYHLERNKPVYACAKDNTLNVALGAQLGQTQTLSGHLAKVTALGWFGAADTLYSGDDSGEIRAWNIAQIPADLPMPEEVNALLPNGSQWLVKHHPKERPPYVTAYSLEGEKQGEPMYFHDQAYYDTNAQLPKPRALERDWWLLNGGKVLALYEGPRSYICIDDCPKDSLEADLTLFNAFTGQLIDRIGSLRSADLLKVDAKREVIALTPKAQPNSVRVYNAADASLLNQFEVANFLVEDIAMLNGEVFALTYNKPSEPYERTIQIVRFNRATNQPEVLFETKAQSGKFVTSVKGDQALVAFDVLQEDQAQWAHVKGSGEVRVFDDKRLDAGRVDYLYTYFHPNGQIWVLQEGQPALAIDTSTLGINALGRVLSDREIGYDWERFEAESEQGRLLGVVKDSKLSLLALGQSIAPVCDELQGLEASAAALSANGRYLALSSSYPERTVVYELSTCTMAFDTEFGTWSNKALSFIGSDRLWVTDNDNRVRRIDLSESDASLHARAKQLGQRLGIGVGVNPTSDTGGKPQ